MEAISSLTKKSAVIFGLVMVITISLLAIHPLFIPGFFPMHDDTQPARVFEMAKALQDGMFPVRWVSDLGYGYGYPIFNFYAPLPYYIGAFLTIIGFDPLTATKVMIGVGMVLAGISMYCLARALCGAIGGIVVALFYVYAPYHAVNLYVRGAISELWAYGLLPFVFLGIFKIYLTAREITMDDEKQFHLVPGLRALRIKNFGQQSSWIVFTALSYAAIILSHNLTAIMITPFLIAFALYFANLAYKQKQLHIIYSLVMSLLLGIVLSAFYWLPALTEMQYTNVISQIGGKADYKDHFVCIEQLWDSPWGFGGSTNDCLDGLSYRIGKLHTIAAGIFLMIWFFVFFFTKRKKTVGYFGLIMLLFLVSIFLTLPYSRVVWDSFSFMSYFQYPWRFLVLASFFSSLIIGGLLLQIQHLFKKRFIDYGIAFLLLLVMFFLYGKLFQPQTILSKSADDYISTDALRWKISKISDEYLPKNFKKPQTSLESAQSRLVVLSGVATVKPVVDKTHIYQADISVHQPSVFRLQLAYFPGWDIRLDGFSFRYATTANGYVFPLRSEEHTITAEFVQTPVEKLANMISLSGAAVLFLAIITKRVRTIARKHHGVKKS